MELLRLEERSEARFGWLRAVEAERRESLGLLTAPDADAVREAPDASARLLRVAAAFHPGSREPPPSNPFRGEDACDSDDAAPAPAPPSRAPPSKRRGRFRLRALLDDASPRRGKRRGAFGMRFLWHVDIS